MNDTLIAHVRQNEDGTWAENHKLWEHLINTSGIAEANAAKFNSGQWGKAAGLAHDAGKGRAEWQKYLKFKSGYDEEAHLESKPGKLPHAIHGAKIVEEHFGKEMGRVLAYCIAGHHSGLQDWSGAAGAGQSSLQFQESQAKGVEEIDKYIVDLIKAARPQFPPWQFSQGLDMSLWIRMLYSCLVDADFLDTETYMDEDKFGKRGDYCSMGELLGRFNKFIRELDAKSEDSRINIIRRDIRKKCVKMAGEDQGIFSLSVPTGGGKTLSSLAFGLEHAIKHKLERIIYVIPYTSIIEQNADVFKAALGMDQVIEHHSSLSEDDLTVKSRLAAENWDAPVIVTTSVQFFESLFAAKSSRCRKLHNIVNSVVILDEAQLVPVEYLSPILEALQLLVEHYGVSIVISTATQPAFKDNHNDGRKFKGVKGIKEIMGDEKEVRELYQSLKRYRLQLPVDLQTAKSWEELAEELKSYKQVLCVVSDRTSCREIYSLMPKGSYHLSALMCGQHRSEVIQAIKGKLAGNEPVRVISTQLIEAGVDLDFPVVYRALAGLDSIAQAAGRCNREGKMPELGNVVVFVPQRKPPIGILRKAAETTCGIISANIKPDDYDVYYKYFSELYWKVNSLDAMDITGLLNPDRQELGINFRTAAERFHIIDESLQQSIMVPYGEGKQLIRLLRVNGPDRWILRKLQRYIVNVYKDTFVELLKKGVVEEVSPHIFAVVLDSEYSDDIGIVIEAQFDPESYIV